MPKLHVIFGDFHYVITPANTYYHAIKEGWWKFKALGFNVASCGPLFRIDAESGNIVVVYLDHSDIIDRYDELMAFARAYKEGADRKPACVDVLLKSHDITITAERVGGEVKGRDHLLTSLNFATSNSCYSIPEIPADQLRKLGEFLVNYAERVEEDATIANEANRQAGS